MSNDPAPVLRPCYACRGAGNGGEGRRCLWCGGTGVDPGPEGGWGVVHDLTGGTDGNAASPNPWEDGTRG